jgi:hypothetical protein
MVGEQAQLVHPHAENKARTCTEQEEQQSEGGYHAGGSSSSGGVCRGAVGLGRRVLQRLALHHH